MAAIIITRTEPPETHGRFITFMDHIMDSAVEHLTGETMGDPEDTDPGRDIIWGM